MTIRIDPNKEICFNCDWFAWAVGMGQGIFCTNENSELCSPRVTGTGKHKCLFNRCQTCDLFEYKSPVFVESIEDFDDMDSDGNIII
jgi:hypothetical protein